jgi:hypothetical protein
MFADGFSDNAARHSATQIQRRVLPEAVRWGGVRGMWGGRLIGLTGLIGPNNRGGTWV